MSKSKLKCAKEPDNQVFGKDQVGYQISYIDKSYVYIYYVVNISWHRHTFVV